MTTPSKKTLLFDLDGTLVDSFPGIRTSFLHTLHEKNWEIPSEERISQVPGPPMEWTFQDLGMTPEQAQDALQTYLEHYGQVGWDLSEAFPGMRDLLIRLKYEVSVCAPPPPRASSLRRRYFANSRCSISSNSWVPPPTTATDAANLP